MCRECAGNVLGMCSQIWDLARLLTDGCARELGGQGGLDGRWLPSFTRSRQGCCTCVGCVFALSGCEPQQSVRHSEQPSNNLKWR